MTPLPSEQNGSMTGGRDERGAVSFRLVVARLLELLVLLAAWAGLVLGAILAGRDARDGNGLAWVWVGLAALGAVVVLAAALVAGSRLVRGEARPRGKHQ